MESICIVDLPKIEDVILSKLESSMRRPLLTSSIKHL